MSKRKCIFFDIDGILPEVLYEVIDNPKSTLNKIASRGLRVEKAVSVFPTVTMCCQASLFTGVYPNRHNIVGNSWFNRYADPPFYRTYTKAREALECFGYTLFGFPTILMPQRPHLTHTNNDLNPDTLTIYERARKEGLTSWEVFNHYSRGVDRWIRPTRSHMVIFAICHEEKLDNYYWDRATVASAIRNLRRHENPDLLTVYISGHDNNSHERGPGDQLRYFRDVVDPLLGRLFIELEKQLPLDEYHMIFTADHSQAPTAKTEDHLITRDFIGEVLGGAGGGGFRLSDEKQVKPVVDTACACTEAGVSQLHVINRKSYDWTDAPRFEEDVLEAAKAFDPWRTGNPPFVDQILVRRSVEEGYVVWENNELIPIEKYYAGREDEYPDAVRRLRGLNCKRSGDLMVTLCYKDGYLYGDTVKSGEHGSLHALDTYVPLIVTGPGVPDKTIPTASIVDVAPTIGHIMGFDVSDCDGKSVLGSDFK